MAMLINKPSDVTSKEVLNTDVLSEFVFDDDDDILDEYVLEDNVLEAEEDFDFGGGDEETPKLKYIIINGKRVTRQEILQRQARIKESINSEVYAELSREEQLIIDLPIIMVKLNFLYSAYCQVHWLEGSGETVEIPFEFPVSVNRSKEAIQTLRKDLKVMEYASWYDWINFTSKVLTKGDSNFLMYNIDIPSINSSYKESVNFLRGITDFGDYTFGNFDFSSQGIKSNLVRSYTVGSSFGDIDDVGSSFGRYSLRSYVKGIVNEQNFNSTDFRKFSLKIKEVGYRFVDEFSFNGFQFLGYWKYDLNNVELPVRVRMFAGTGTKWVLLSNKAYRDLRSKSGLGKDFILQTPPRYISGDNLPKNIKPIIFFIEK